MSRPFTLCLSLSRIRLVSTARPTIHVITAFMYITLLTYSIVILLKVDPEQDQRATAGPSHANDPNVSIHITIF